MSTLSTEQAATAGIVDNIAEYDVFRGQGSEMDAAEWEALFNVVVESASQPNADPAGVVRDFYELATSAASSLGPDDSRTSLATLLYAYYQALKCFNSDQLLEAAAYAMSVLEIELKAVVGEERAAQDYLQTVSKNARKLYFASMLPKREDIRNRSPLAISGAVQDTLESPQAVERRQAAMAYLYLARSRPDIVDWHSKQIRIGLKRELAAWLGDELGFDEQTPWHEMWPLMLNEFQHRREDVHRLSSALLESETVVDAANYLTSFIRALRQYVVFASARGRDIVQSAIERIPRAFGEFLHERDTVSTAAYRQIVTQLESLEQVAGYTRFWIGACIVAPVSQHVRRIVEHDYKDRASRFYPELRVEIARPGYPLVKDSVETITLHIRNSGTSEALNVLVLLSPRGGFEENLTCLNPVLEYGTIPVTLEPYSAEARIAVNGEVSVAYLECELVWTDLMGEQREVGELRLAQQHEVDWDKHQANPYFLRSIGPDERDRLRGREDSMVSLRQGIKSMSSFHITGQKRVGKTSIATTFQGELETQSGYSVVRPARLPSQVPDDSSEAVGNLELLRLIEVRLDMEELRTLCFALQDKVHDLQYDNLRGEGVVAKARDLIDFVKRRDKLPLLLDRLSVQRPDLEGEIAGLSSAIQDAKSFDIGQREVSVPDTLSPTCYLPIYLFWGDLSGLPPSGIFHFLASRAHSRYREVFGEDLAVEVPSREVFEEGYGAAFTTFITDISRKYQNLMAIFILDDFDEIEPELYTGPEGNRFFTALRAHINRRNTSFVFVAGERLQRILHYQGERLNQVQPLRVDYLDNTPEFAELVRYPTRGVLRFTDPAVGEIYRLSAGNPYYAMLICNRIYQIVWRRRNAWVVPEDVLEATEMIVQEADQGQFSHFWNDGPHAGTEREAKVTEANRLILYYTARMMRHPEDYAASDSVIRARELRMYDPLDLEKIVAELVVRGVLQRNPDQQDRIRPRVRLLSKWLQGRGGDLVTQGIFTDEQRRTAAEKKYRVSTVQIESIAKQLYYQGGSINAVKIELWLEQLGDVYEQYLAFRLLERLVTAGYIDEDATRGLFKELYDQVKSDSGIVIKLDRMSRPQNVLVSTAKSQEIGALELVRLFRTINRIPSDSCGRLDEIVELVEAAVNDESQPQGLIVWLDDFVGSGIDTQRVIERGLDVLDRNSPGWTQRFRLYYAALAGYSHSVEKLNELFRPKLKILVGKKFGAEVHAFEPNADIFDNETDRETAHAMARRIGVDLCPEAPLGRGDSQSLVLYSVNCPDTTLPIFWRDGEEDISRQWRALFPPL